MRDPDFLKLCPKLVILLFHVVILDLFRRVYLPVLIIPLKNLDFLVKIFHPCLQLSLFPALLRGFRCRRLFSSRLFAGNLLSHRLFANHSLR